MDHPSLADSVFSLKLRESVTDEHRANEGLADSDEWEGLASSSKCPSSDSLVAVEKPDDAVDQHSKQQPNQQEHEEGGNDAQKILLSVAAIGAAAFGIFVANRPQQSTSNERNRSNNNNDTDWVTVESRSEE
jgi:hypothetical protein